jgi:hypothetical protein
MAPGFYYRDIVGMDPLAKVCIGFHSSAAHSDIGCAPCFNAITFIAVIDGPVYGLNGWRCMPRRAGSPRRGPFVTS